MQDKNTLGRGQHRLQIIMVCLAFGKHNKKSKNKFTTLKNAFIETFEELGGVDNLVEWATA